MLRYSTRIFRESRRRGWFAENGLSLRLFGWGASIQTRWTDSLSTWLGARKMYRRIAWHAAEFGRTLWNNSAECGIGYVVVKSLWFGS